MRNKTKNRIIFACVFAFGLLLGIGFSYIDQYIHQIAG